MSCYDWRRLLAHRFDPAGEPDAEWEAASRHLEHCGDCRAEALALDPTLGFRGASRWTPDREERESVRLGVRTLLRTGRLASDGDGERRTSRRGLGRLASAVLFAVVLAMLPGGTARQRVDSEPARGASEAPTAAIRGPLAPAIEGLDRPQARVYEWGGDDLSVVMVVDESLDV